MTMRTSIHIITLISVAGFAAVSASASLAQAQGGGGPPVGSSDAGRMASSSREQQANYNRVIGSIDRPTEAVKAGLKGKAVPATAADMKVGSALRDVAGVPIGNIVSVAPDGAVVDTGKTKIKVPTVAFGKDDNGLLLGITAARFNELMAKAKGSN
jgi:hypothetical protein